MPHHPFDLPRPLLRLAFTVALGLLGAVLFPPRLEFFVHRYASFHGPAAGIWVGAVLAAVLLLHRFEKSPMPALAYAVLGLMAPLTIALFLALALVPFYTFARGPLWAIVTGQLFTAPFHLAHVGFVLDQPTIGKWFFLFCMFAAFLFWALRPLERKGRAIAADEHG